MIESVRGAWIPVEDAGKLVNRSKWTIYRWAKQGKVGARRGPDGVTRVWGSDVLDTESKTKRGRPEKETGEDHE